jgi:glycosyltransferase involved in cell wall biosynthesis
MSDNGCVDLLYLACNRLEFTRETFAALIANTDWAQVSNLLVYDDGSADGTLEWLSENITRVPAPSRLVRTRFASPVAAMVDFISKATAPLLAKTDNDAMLPPGWLTASLEVMNRHPELALLGIEAMYPHNADAEVVRSFIPAPFVSGLGMYRRSAFAPSLPQVHDCWYGFEEWQVSAGNGLMRGWIAPALPVFLLDRCPFEPWVSLTARYDRLGYHRSWPKYERDSTLWKWRWPEQIESRPVPQARFLCAMRVKNEGRYIQEVIGRALELCEHAIVLDDHSTDDTAAICRAFGERVTLIPSPFEGFDESRDKNYLLSRIVERNPEWVLWIDGDEVLERTGPEKIRAAATASPETAAFSLRVAYLWNHPNQVRVDGIYSNFSRASLFRLRGQAIPSLQFVPTGFGGNLHCGNVPQGLTGPTKALDVRLKHYGYLSKEVRMKKYHFYSTVDPNNAAEDNYRHLAEIRGARFAPGRARLVPWQE